MVVVSSILVLAAASAAVAASVAQKRAEIRQIEFELFTLDSKARAASEAHRAAEARVRDLEQRLTIARRELSSATKQLGMARVRLADRVEAIYRQHRPSTLQLFMNSRSLTGAVESYRMIKRIGNQDRQVVTGVRSVKTRLTVLRKRLAGERRRARIASRVAAQRRGELQAAAGARRSVLVQAQRSLTQLIAQEQARAAQARLAALRAARASIARRVDAPVGTPASGIAPAPAGAISTGGGAPTSALEQIAQCESGGNPRAISPGGTYRGKYQFHPDTWRGLGGSGDPARASEAEQDRLAALLYARSGASPWPVCGR